MDRMRMLYDWRVYCRVCRGCLPCAGPGGKEIRQERRAAETGNTVVKKEVVMNEKNQRGEIRRWCDVDLC